MKITTVFFDLDGTLLLMNEDDFVQIYFKELAKKVIPMGYDKDLFVPSVWQGTKAMVKNDGTKTNEEAFWEAFSAIHNLFTAGKQSHQNSEQKEKDPEGSFHFSLFACVMTGSQIVNM